MGVPSVTPFVLMTWPVNVTAPPHPSLPVGTPIVRRCASQSAALKSGGAVNVGGVVSLTVTACVAVLVRLAASVAVQVTVVVPRPYVAGALFVTVGSAPPDRKS